MGFSKEDLKPLIQVLSGLVGIALLALSCAGFERLSKSSGSLEGQASFGCMCVLGVIFGALLFFGETKLEKFFFLFGFMRYRVGRAVVFIIAGIMVAIIGKNLNDNSSVLLIIEGAACLACATLQLLGVFWYGNNTSASTSAKTPGNTTAPPAPSSYTPPTPAPAARPTPRTNSSAFHPVVANKASHDEDPNTPAWMRA